MGGLLSAEVVLFSSSHPDVIHDFRHRIVGTMNFDCPFLGMHPGVVISGIGSIFRSSPASPAFQPQDPLGRGQRLGPAPLSNDLLSPSPSISPSAEVSQAQSSNDFSTSHVNASETPAIPIDLGSLTLKSSRSISSSSQDPNYNPPFPNDIRIPVRSGWDNALHFVTKHSNDLSKAAKSYVTSHLEFGGCLADYKGLKSRYTRLRALEDIDFHQADHQARIRFVNYYTASTGRPKKAKLVPPKALEAQNTLQIAAETTVNPVLEHLTPTTSTSGLPLTSPRISVEEYQEGDKITETSQNSVEHNAVASDQTIYQALDQDLGQTSGQTLVAEEPTTLIDENIVLLENSLDEIWLPPLPKLPDKPPPFNPAAYTDKQIRNLALKQHYRQTKRFLRALEDHKKAIKERRKLIEKKKKLAIKEAEKKSRLEEKEKVRSRKGAEPKTVSSPAKLNPESGCVSDGSSDEAVLVECGAEKPKRDKKFCLLPPRTNQELDPCWIRVFMNGVDEVGAHCGLFIVGDHYGWLVDDVGTRIKEWVDQK